jgi:hypothetical protein
MVRIPNPKPTPNWHAPFLQILPLVRRYANRCFAACSHHAREEAVAEVVGHAMKAVESAVLKGKDPTKLATCIAYFAVLRVKNGRMVAGIAADDIFSQLAQERTDSPSDRSMTPTFLRHLGGKRR